MECGAVSPGRTQATAKALQRSHDRRYRSRQDAEAALNTLATIGLGRWEAFTPHRGGHTTRTFVLADSCRLRTADARSKNIKVDVDTGQVVDAAAC
jgi:hypothetical protein